MTIKTLNIPFSFSEPPLYEELKYAQEQLDKVRKNCRKKIFQKGLFYTLYARQKELLEALGKYCKFFFDRLLPEGKAQLYKKIAEVWKREIGGFLLEKDEDFASRLIRCQPGMIFRAIEDPPIQKQAALEEGGEGDVKITSADLSVKCTIYSLDEKNPLFSRAYEALYSGVQQMPFSGNYWREPASFYSREKLKRMGKRRDEIRVLAEKEFNQKKHPCEFARALVYGDTLKPSFIGNCGELSRTAFAYLFKGADKVEIFSIGNGDHVFIVLGRERGSDPQKPATWGPHAIVLDVWAREIYPARLIPQHLKDYKKKINDEGKPVLEAFDPRSQYLIPLASNITFPEEFEKDSTMKLSHIEELLTEFHALPQGDERLPKAEEIAEAIFSYPLLFFAELRNPALSQLLCQMLQMLPENWKVKEQEEKPDSLSVVQALDIAHKTGNVEPLCRVVNSGAKLEPYDLYKVSGMEPEFLFFKDALDIAVGVGAFAVLDFAIAAGAKPHPMIFDYALELAIENCDIEILIRVMVAGAKNPFEDSFSKVFAYVEKNGDLDMLQLVVEDAGATLPPFSNKQDFFDRAYEIAMNNMGFLRFAVMAGAEPTDAENKEKILNFIRKGGDYSGLSDLYTPVPKV